MKRYVIFGASRGLGAALSAGVPEAGDVAWLIARKQPELERGDGVRRLWIQADLAARHTPATVAEALYGQPIDVLIYNAGIWEKTAFSDDYDFEQVPPAETERVLAVNLTAAIHCLQRLLANVRQAGGGKIILIGSTSGLENARAPEVAYNASKFGLRGVAHGLREVARRDGVAVTVINPGSLATDVPYADGAAAALNRHGRSAIPLSDLVLLVKCLVALSPAACVKEIDLPAMDDLAA